MELINLLRILWRWSWLILSVVVVTVLVLLFWLRTAEPIYAAQVTLQISTPQQEDVAAFDQYRYVSLRDEVTVARNNFTEVLQSEEVYNRTISQLALEGNDATYVLDVKLGRDVDFIYVRAEARTSKLAALIANTHVEAAITYYGELRAKPTEAEKSLFAEQLDIAEEEFRAAEDAFAEFKAQNGIALLENGLATYQKLLEELQLEHDRRVLEWPSSYVDPVGEVDELIAQRQQELARLVGLAPMYNVLEENARQARERYQHVLNKHTEAELKAKAVQAANFIQIVEQAQAPPQPMSNSKKLLVLALAGSLGLGVLLSFLLEYISGFAVARLVPAGARWKIPQLQGVRQYLKRKAQLHLQRQRRDERL